MTTPAPQPIPVDWANTPTFCTECEIHQATSTRPVCPVCLDEDRRAKEAS